MEGWCSSGCKFSSVSAWMRASFTQGLVRSALQEQILRWGLFCNLRKGSSSFQGMITARLTVHIQLQSPASLLLSKQLKINSCSSWMVKGNFFWWCAEAVSQCCGFLVGGRPWVSGPLHSQLLEKTMEGSLYIQLFLLYVEGQRVVYFHYRELLPFLYLKMYFSMN